MGRPLIICNNCNEPLVINTFLEKKPIIRANDIVYVELCKCVKKEKPIPDDENVWPDGPEPIAEFSWFN
ncbi:hypothetical protein LCGC14_3148590 [marine sediment metagenome]|uniref:Uncharacterized protein n=1 Tax=marine sediment metagenome TaxID=412755 RepID=A0A0F8Y1M6_9ZZZZ